jgi:hypothetical protein
MIPLMNRKHGRWLAQLIIAACLILACVALTRKVQAAYLNHQVKTMTAEMKDLKMKPMCVGRFLIDIPADAEVSYRGAMSSGWSIATYDNETDEQFASRVETKETQLAGEKNERGMPNLESTHQVDKNGMHGKIHVFGREWIRGLPNEPLSENIRIEAMIRVQKHSFNLTIKYSDDNDLKKLAELVTQFRSREENEIPIEAGYCFDGGFITEPITAKQTERTTMFVGLNGHPDVSIALDMTAGITTAEPLLERHERVSAENEYRSRFHTFRAGTRTLNGQAGDELLERVHEFNGNYGHKFMWEAVHNKIDNVFTPDMSFELSTGHGQPGTTVDSSLTDAEALALWDKMLSSLRIRPVVAAKPVAAAPPQVPLGTLADSGMDCPASGWWRCVDALANDGMHWFGHGHILPRIALRQQLSLLERLKGTPTVISQRVAWEFVRHDDGEKERSGQAAEGGNADKPA